MIKLSFDSSWPRQFGLPILLENRTLSELAKLAILPVASLEQKPKICGYGERHFESSHAVSRPE
jgi:hypothetical protein